MTYAIIVLFFCSAIRFIATGIDLAKDETPGMVLTSLFMAVLTASAGGYLCYLAAQ